MNKSNEFITHCRRLYRETLLDDVVPFWMQHGIDHQYGGIGNILDDLGRVLGHEKFFWSQGRALWTFSALYNRIDKRQEWLDFATHIYRYVSTHGRDEKGRWMYRLDKDGNTLDRDISIAVDGFVMNGLSEYYAATGNGEALDLALDTQRSIADRLAVPGSYGLAPYEIPPELKNQGVRMLYAFFFYDLGEIAGRVDIQQHGIRLAHEILEDFYVPEKDAILEFVSLDGKFVDTPPGRTCVPGHAIEALWFLITIFERIGDKERIQTCCRLIQRHLDIAWDEEFGGLMLACDIDGKTPVYWKKHECKPWWVQVEALVATAYAFKHTQDTHFLDWHRRIQEVAYAHYPVATGEWRQWFTREWQTMESAGLPVKDPFHLPRALIYLTDLFERLHDTQ